VVWRLDRLGRSMTHLVILIQALLQRHVSFRSLSDGAMDMTTASGELVFHIFSALAQFERRLIQERTHAGLGVARTRGQKGGRTPRHAEEPRVRMAYTMSESLGTGHLSGLTALPGHVLSLCGPWPTRRGDHVAS
jgi:DNA invertase Pin-like site-specific DNA recombinase